MLEPADRGDDDDFGSFDCARRMGCDCDGSEYQGFESLMTEQNMYDCSFIQLTPDLSIRRPSAAFTTLCPGLRAIGSCAAFQLSNMLYYVIFYCLIAILSCHYSEYLCRHLFAPFLYPRFIANTDYVMHLMTHLYSYRRSVFRILSALQVHCPL